MDESIIQRVPIAIHSVGELGIINKAIADNIAPYVNQIYSDPLKYSSLQVLTGVFLFSFQIYADFLGIQPLLWVVHVCLASPSWIILKRLT